MILSAFFENHTLLFLLYMGLIGLIIGSFLNVVVVRLPLMMQHPSTTLNLYQPRSFCIKCEKSIKIRDNIPLLSFLLLKGRCRFCQHAIPWRYPFIEVLTALLTLITAWQFGLSLACLGALIFTWSLIALTFIDGEIQLLPDNLTLPLLWLGIIFNLSSHFCSLQDSVLGAIIGYLSFWSFAGLFQIISRKKGMGHGDFKLLSALGAWLGWQALPLIIVLSSFTGSLIAIGLLLSKRLTRNQPVPFGPFLAGAGWLSLIWHDKIIHYYHGLFNI